MSLSSDESLPSDGGTIGNTYRLILTTHVPTAFCVGSGGAGVCDIAPGPGNGRVDAWNIVANVMNGATRVLHLARDVGNGGMNVWNGWMCVYSKFGLGSDS